MKKGKSSPEEEEEDRISSLPDSLIHQILSFLKDAKFAVQTCVLSKRWRYTWTSMPVLKFSDGYHICRSSEEESDEESLNEFEEFVENVVSLHDDNSDIQRLHLEFQTFYTPVSTMSRWIATAVDHNVQELYIDTNPDDEEGFEIPPCLCICESLTKMELNLRGDDIGDYDSKIILPCKMSLPRIKSLRLRLQHISFEDEKLTNMFFSSFLSLESLIMEISHDAFPEMNVNISLPNLKYFEFDGQYTYEKNSEVKLHAPSLESFILNSYLSTNLTLENLSSLVTADIHVRGGYYVPGTSEMKEIYALHAVRLLRGIQNAKVLTLNDPFLKALGGAPDILDTQPLEFYNLQHLKLSTYLSSECLRSIIYILKHSPTIESFSLHITQLSPNSAPAYPYCDEVKFNSENTGIYWEAGLFLPCMLHHLKVVEINGLLGRVNEAKFLEILLKHAIVLEKVVLSSNSTKQDSPREKRMKKFSEMLLKFPRASKNIIILFQI